MIKILKRTTQKLFGAQLEFRVRMFNIMAAAGTLISLAAGVTGVFIGAGLANFLLNMVTMVLSAALLLYSYVSGKYQLCYTISVICIFLILFPAIFFSGGGYHSGMPLYFVFAVLFTVFMLDGKKMIIITAVEAAVYISLCIFAHYHPQTINFLDSDADIMSDVIISFIIVSAALGVTMGLHLRIYIQRLKELETARIQIEEYDKMKSELFAGMSHEMRTPLTVMSTYAQYAVEQIRQASSAGAPGVTEQTAADLVTISDEAKRLAQMADGTLKILMSVVSPRGAHETDKDEIRKSLPVNMADLCTRLARLMEPVASRKGKKLIVLTADSIQEIQGYADALTQLVWNILHNAIIHSDAKTIKLSVETINSDIQTDVKKLPAPKLQARINSPGVKITISDDGTGIDPQIMPRIFDRGVSGNQGGSGIGLSICKEIAILHGGDISVQNGKSAENNALAATQADTGTCVTVILRGLAGLKPCGGKEE